MVRIYTEGFETGFASSGMVGYWTGSGASVTIQGTTKRSGNFAAKCDSGAGNATGLLSGPTASGHTFADGVASFFRSWLYFDNLPGSEIQVCNWLTSGAGIKTTLDASGVVRAYAGTTGQTLIGTSTIPITTGAWFCIDVGLRINSAADDWGAVRLNFLTFADAILPMSATLTSWYAQTGWIQAPGANKVCYVDDLAVNDANSSYRYNDSWCGPGKVVMSLPIADLGRAALWTGGVGGTTNLYQAVDNTPPTGTATETDLTQIEHAGNSGATNDSYIAQMTAPSTLGIVADSLVMTTTTGLAGLSIGTATTNEKVAQKITTPNDGITRTAIEFSLSKTGSPTDTVVVALCSDNAGVPGTTLASIEVGTTWLTGNLQPAYFENVSIAPNTTYWVVFSRTGSLSAVDYARVGTNAQHNFNPSQPSMRFQPVGIYNYVSGAWTGPTADTYIALGLISITDDIITDVRGIYVAGEDIATGTKQLGGANSFDYQSYAGADVTEGSSAALGTYPSNWHNFYSLRGNLSWEVNKRLGTAYSSHWFAVVRPETATRVASVCFMGVLIEYIPYEAPKPRPTQVIRQAVNRAGSF